MATTCTKCGKDVDTLAKRIHRCRSPRVYKPEQGNQLVLGSFAGRGFGIRPYLRKSREEREERRRYLARVESTE